MCWKKIDNFSSYEISTNGVIRKCFSKDVVHQFTNDKNTLCVKIKDDSGKFILAKVHFLVYKTFKRNFKSSCGRIHHIDGDKTNNKSCNLKYTFFKKGDSALNKISPTNDIEFLPNGEIKVSKSLSSNKILKAIKDKLDIMMKLLIDWSRAIEYVEHYLVVKEVDDFLIYDLFSYINSLLNNRRKLTKQDIDEIVDMFSDFYKELQSKK